MKKILAIILAAVMIAACSVTAFAAEVNQDSDPQQQSAVISADVAPAYIVSIPADTTVTFNTEYTDFGAVELTSARLEPDKCVKVTLTTDGELNNSVDDTKVIPYTIVEGKADSATDTTYTTAAYLAEGDKTDLTIKITQDDWNNAYAGHYGDTVTFDIAYTTVNP